MVIADVKNVGVRLLRKDFGLSRLQWLSSCWFTTWQTITSDLPLEKIPTIVGRRDLMDRLFQSIVHIEPTTMRTILTAIDFYTAFIECNDCTYIIHTVEYTFELVRNLWMFLLTLLFTHIRVFDNAVDRVSFYNALISEHMEMFVASCLCLHYGRCKNAITMTTKNNRWTFVRWRLRATAYWMVDSFIQTYLQLPSRSMEDLAQSLPLKALFIASLTATSACFVRELQLYIQLYAYAIEVDIKEVDDETILDILWKFLVRLLYLPITRPQSADRIVTAYFEDGWRYIVLCIRI